MLLQILWTIFSLGIVIAIAYFILLLLKKKGFGKVEGTYIKVLDVVQIGQDRQLLLVEVEGKRLLIGVTSSNIRLISELRDSKDIHYTGDRDEQF